MENAPPDEINLEENRYRPSVRVETEIRGTKV